MTQNKKIIGITGGSGCGKSYISELLRRRGIPVADADKTAREVMKKGSLCLAETTDFFGERILLENGELNRKELAKIVFSDEKKLKKLNEITHKYIMESIYNEIERSEGGVAGADGAVLIESGFKCDMMIGVLADRAIRKKRIMLRDTLCEEEAEARINAQPQDDFYIKNCDFTIVNNGGEIDIDAVIERIEA